MAALEDSAEVLSALRLGWYVAELRGRNRPGGPVPPAETLPNRQGHARRGKEANPDHGGGRRRALNRRQEPP